MWRNSEVPSKRLLSFHGATLHTFFTLYSFKSLLLGEFSSYWDVKMLVQHFEHIRKKIFCLKFFLFFIIFEKMSVKSSLDRITLNVMIKKSFDLFFNFNTCQAFMMQLSGKPRTKLSPSVTKLGRETTDENSSDGFSSFDILVFLLSSKGFVIIFRFQNFFHRWCNNKFEAFTIADL